MDIVARKFKSYYFRDRVAILESSTDFNVPEMHVSAINEFNGSAAVERFVRQLRASRTGETLDDDYASSSSFKVKKINPSATGKDKGPKCHKCKKVGLLRRDCPVIEATKAAADANKEAGK